MHSILAARTEFSIGESILSAERLVELAVEKGAKAVAMTDTMSITAMIDFTNRAKKAGVKPIIGCRLRLVDDPGWRKTKEDKKAPPEYFATLYVLKEEGLRALFRLLTKANSEDRFYTVPKLSFGDLTNELREIDPTSVALATGDALGVIHHPDAVNILRGWKIVLGASVYVQLTPLNGLYWDALNHKAIVIGDQLELPFLVTSPTFYAQGDADAHEIMGAVSRNVKLTDPWHFSSAVRDVHPLSNGELRRRSAETIERLRRQRHFNSAKAFKSGLLNTDKLVESVEFEWSKQPVSLPTLATNENERLVEECRKGWSIRFGRSVFDHKPTEEELTSVYKPRLAYELKVLRSLGFAGYFLLVQDTVEFAKKNKILVGPGRGSVGGSLVAYLMGITDCDPIRFGLLFERFINPERLDLPDADLDFMSARRHEVVDYLVSKYGDKRVAGIANYMTLGPASAVGKVSKAFGLNEDQYRCTKLMPKLHGQPIPLEDAAKQVAEVGEFRDKFRPIWDRALTLEGVVNALGRHAAGVVVGGCDLVERSVVERRKDGATVCWDKRIVEDQGLVKIDILGLSTLDLIALTLEYVRERHSSKVDLLRIPLDDAEVLKNFAEGATTGIFQFESGGMKRLLRDLGADGTLTFDDIAAATALYRPGPMDSGMMDSYVKRKQGLEVVEYDHPSMVEALKDTCGVAVYQEQVMRLSRDVAGYTMAEADKLRKIMGKKLPEEMKKEGAKFIAGCVKTVGMSESEAEVLFDKIAAFAGYGFNKSHSVEYSLISYQSMWLKTHFPVEFFAAALSLMDEDKLPALLRDAARSDIEVMLPDVNLSTGRFEIITDTRLCIPFSRVKGLTERTSNAILEARKAGKFKSVADFEDRVNKTIVNSGKRKALDLIGAFASIDPAALPQNHPDRIRDQRDLVPGLVEANVPVNRTMDVDSFTKVALGKIVETYRDKHADDGMPVKPALGKNAKFMVIFDAPSRSEEREGRMAWGESFGNVAEALYQAGFKINDGYWTALIKRPKAGKQVSPDEITTYGVYLKQEIETLKPPVIVLMGSTTVRHFLPDFKGKASDSAGKVVYSKDLDANLIIGFSPGEIYHDSSKQTAMNEVFGVVASLTEV